MQSDYKAVDFQGFLHSDGDINPSSFANCFIPFQDNRKILLIPPRFSRALLLTFRISTNDQEVLASSKIFSAKEFHEIRIIQLNQGQSDFTPCPRRPLFAVLVWVSNAFPCYCLRAQSSLIKKRSQSTVPFASKLR